MSACLSCYLSLSVRCVFYLMRLLFRAAYLISRGRILRRSTNASQKEMLAEFHISTFYCFKESDWGWGGSGVGRRRSIDGYGGGGGLLAQRWRPHLQLDRPTTATVRLLLDAALRKFWFGVRSTQLRHFCLALETRLRHFGRVDLGLLLGVTGCNATRMVYLLDNDF